MSHIVDACTPAEENQICDRAFLRCIVTPLSKCCGSSFSIKERWRRVPWLRTNNFSTSSAI